MALTRRIKKRNSALKRIAEIDQKAEHCLVIHYSCESFYDKTDGKTPRVTSIALRNLSSAQTESFSIHKIAEQQKIDFSCIESEYDSLEKEMLKEFYDYVSKNKNYTWIHWNMRDINYGFMAIEHRFKVLDGTPIEIPEERKFDLARALVYTFGIQYINHPRLENIIKLNKISQQDLLLGKAEAEAFTNKEFVKIHQSTLRKVDVLSNIFELLADGNLKNLSTWKDIYGLSFESIITCVKQHWIISLITILSVIISFICKIKGLF